jgi:hypothetical protein
MGLGRVLELVSCRTELEKITNLIALFPTTHIHGGGAYLWISSYIAQDPDVQRQLRDRVITAEDEDAPPSPRNIHHDIDEFWHGGRHHNHTAKPRGGTWIRMGVAATISPVTGMMHHCLLFLI